MPLPWSVIQAAYGLAYVPSGTLGQQAWLAFLGLSFCGGGEATCRIHGRVEVRALCADCGLPLPGSRIQWSGSGRTGVQAAGK